MKKNQAKTRSITAVLVHWHFILLVWFWEPEKNLLTDLSLLKQALCWSHPYQHCLRAVISTLLSGEQTACKGPGP